MQIKVMGPVARVRGEEMLLTDGQSALDLIATVRCETDCDRIALDQAAVSPDFFRLATGVAGDVLQKFANYHAKLAIIGDFTAIQSKPLREFIYESNRGNTAFFVATEGEAIEKLTAAC